MILTYKRLKKRQRAERDHYTTNLGLRVHRALSWLKRAEQCDDDLDAKSAAHRALGKKNTAKVLGIIFNRLYMLRNQMIHGGATWNSSVNRDQIRDSVNILGKLIPITIKLMMDNGKAIWGTPCYPVL